MQSMNAAPCANASGISLPKDLPQPQTETQFTKGADHAPDISFATAEFARPSQGQPEINAEVSDQVLDAQAAALLTRFWSKVQQRSADECWEWLAGAKKAGYGHLH